MQMLGSILLCSHKPIYGVRSRSSYTRTIKLVARAGHIYLHYKQNLDCPCNLYLLQHTKRYMPTCGVVPNFSILQQLIIIIIIRSQWFTLLTSTNGALDLTHYWSTFGFKSTNSTLWNQNEGKTTCLPTSHWLTLLTQCSTTFASSKRHPDSWDLKRHWYITWLLH